MLRILVVDDESGFRSIMETILKLNGYEVHLAANGTNGLSQARSKRPDIILSDVNMPGLSGSELCAAVRADPSLARCYFVLITGEEGEGAKFDGLRAGADDFLSKPVTGPQILGRLEVAQKVMAIQELARASAARADSLGQSMAQVDSEVSTLEGLLTQAEACIAEDDIDGLKSALRLALEAADAVRTACDS